MPETAKKKALARWAVPDKPAVGPALAAGLVRGLVGGLLPGLVCLLLDPHSPDTVVIAAGIPLAATCLAIAEEIAPLAPSFRDSILAAGGLLAPLALILPWLSALGYWVHLRSALLPGADEVPGVLSAIVFGVFVGVAFALADRSVKSTTRWAHLKRLALAALGLGLFTVFLPSFFWGIAKVTGATWEFPYRAVLIGLAFVPVALLLGLGSAAAHGLAERARGWLESGE